MLTKFAQKNGSKLEVLIEDQKARIHQIVQKSALFLFLALNVFLQHFQHKLHYFLSPQVS